MASRFHPNNSQSACHPPAFNAGCQNINASQTLLNKASAKATLFRSFWQRQSILVKQVLFHFPAGSLCDAAGNFRVVDTSVEEFAASADGK